MTTFDIAVVGGGPAGLALAIESVSRGLSTVVLERFDLPRDKACGEGLMPSGVRCLERLGIRALLGADHCRAIEGIRYVQEDGSRAEARLPFGGGLGVRRIALSAAMTARARGAGVDVRERTALREHQRTQHGFELVTESERVGARILVAADGLASPLRHREGLQAARSHRRRYGIRRHFRVTPWSSFVEVHLSKLGEAYVTPVGREQVGIAFLWERRDLPQPVSFESLLAHFPSLQARVRGSEVDSPVMGAGPLEQRARHQVADGFALLGDAAGYVDALSGEGLSLALRSAEILGALLPGALAAGGRRSALLPYEREFRRMFRRYAWVSHGMLRVADHPRARPKVVEWLGNHAGAFERMVRFWACL